MHKVFPLSSTHILHVLLLTGPLSPPCHLKAFSTPEGSDYSNKLTFNYHMEVIPLSIYMVCAVRATY